MKAEQNSVCQCSLLSSRFTLRKSGKYGRGVWEMGSLARKRESTRLKLQTRRVQRKQLKLLKTLV